MPTAIDEVTAAPAGVRPPLGELFRIWLSIGTTSFGGGSATQLLMQRQFVTTRRWMSPEEFAQAWAIVQFAPGVNQIAMTVLMGYRFAGFAGAAVSLVGMMTPAIGLTIAMTALYARIRTLPAVAAALHGVTPAVVGLSLAFMWRLVAPPMTSLHRRDLGSLLIGVALIMTAAALTAAGVPVLACYLAGAIALGTLHALHFATPSDSSGGRSKP